MSEIIVGLDGLYRDGIKLKLEFGNDEQIAAIRKHERKIEQFKEGFGPNYNYTVKGHSYFSCICGNVLRSEVDADHEDDILCFEGEEKECGSCKRKYEYIIERDYRVNSSGKRYVSNEDLVVKLKK